MNFNLLTKSIIEKFIIEANKEENKLLMEKHLVNPLIKTISDKVEPYIKLMIIIYIIIIILIIIILILLLFNK